MFGNISQLHGRALALHTFIHTQRCRVCGGKRLRGLLPHCDYADFLSVSQSHPKMNIEETPTSKLLILNFQLPAYDLAGIAGNWNISMSNFRRVWSFEHM
jgi:hypothetical protein